MIDIGPKFYAVPSPPPYMTVESSRSHTYNFIFNVYVKDFRTWRTLIWAAPSEFVSSSIPSWQTLTAHAQPFRGARDLAFCLKVPLDSLLVWASSEGSGETARMRRLAWTFTARIGDKYQIRLARPIWKSINQNPLTKLIQVNVNKYVHGHLAKNSRFSWVSSCGEVHVAWYVLLCGWQRNHSLDQRLFW